MAETVSVRVEGIDQAIRSLRTIDYNARRRVASAGVRAGNRVFVKAARSAAPKRTGVLAKSIRGSVKLDRSAGTLRGTVASKATRAQKKKGHDSYYAHMVIGGAKPHAIPKSRRGVIAIGRKVYRRVQHPGTRPNPFLEQVATREFNNAVRAFEKAFGEKLEKEITAARE